MIARTTIAFLYLAALSGELPVGKLCAQSAAPLESATREAPYVNSLGMRFVPLPTAAREKVLFSIWPTRIQDYTTFCSETGRTYQKWNWAPVMPPGMPATVATAPVYEEDPNYPVIAVTWLDAMAFCEWLTTKERAAGHLPAHAEVRLPTDREWSIAAGLDEPADETPKQKDAKKPGFAWGDAWPPPANVANLSGDGDKFPKLSPVGSFPSNVLGIYDMAGNVEQWCYDLYDPGAGNQRVGRGSAWAIYTEDALRLSQRVQARPETRGNLRGFRCVIAVDPIGGTPDTLVVREKFELPQLNGTILAKVRGTQVRQELMSAAAGDAVVLCNLQTDQMTTLNTAQKTASVSSLSAEMKKSPLLVEAFRRDHPWTTPVSAGKQEKVGAWNTEIFTSEWAGAKATMWVTRDIPDWERMKTRLETLGKAMSPLGFDPAALALPGLAVKTTLAAGKDRATFTVLSLYETQTSESDYVAPSQFRLVLGGAGTQAQPTPPTQRPAAAAPTAAPPVATPTPRQLNPAEFEISSIIIGAPSIAIINGRDYEAGQTVMALRSGMSAQLKEIREGSVLLQGPVGTIEVKFDAKSPSKPIKPPRPKPKKP